MDKQPRRCTTVAGTQKVLWVFFKDELFAWLTENETGAIAHRDAEVGRNSSTAGSWDRLADFSTAWTSMMRGISTASLPRHVPETGHHLGTTEFAKCPNVPSASRHNLFQLGGSKLQGLDILLLVPDRRHECSTGRSSIASCG